MHFRNSPKWVFASYSSDGLCNRKIINPTLPYMRNWTVNRLSPFIFWRKRFSEFFRHAQLALVHNNILFFCLISFFFHYGIYRPLAPSINVQQQKGAGGVARFFFLHLIHHRQHFSSAKFLLLLLYFELLCAENIK